MKRRYIHPVTIAVTITSEGIAAGSVTLEYSDSPASHDTDILTQRQNSIWEEDSDE